VNAALLIEGSFDGKSFAPVAGANATIAGTCTAGGRFAKSLAARTFAETWVTVTIMNGGGEALTEVGVTSTLHGGGALMPTPPPAPPPVDPYDPNCKSPASERAKCCGTCDPDWHCKYCQKNGVDGSACLSCEAGYTHSIDFSDCTGSCRVGSAPNGQRVEQ
jgi:hypothetical protein